MKTFLATRYEYAAQWVIIGLQDILEIVAFRGQKSTGTWVIEATEFKFEVRSDLRGHLEAATVSEAIILAILGNMHIDARVIEVACIKS